MGQPLNSGQVGRQAEAGRQAGREAGREAGRQAGRQAGRDAGREEERQAGRRNKYFASHDPRVVKIETFPSLLLTSPRISLKAP